MGMISSVAMAERMAAGAVTVQEAMTWHLRSNFLPPIREAWIPVCVGIIERVRAGDADLSYKIHAPGKPDDVLERVETIIDDLHLDPFVSDEIVATDEPYEESK